MTNTLRCSRSYQRLILRCVLAAALVAAILCFGSTWPPVASADCSKNGHHLSRELSNQQERLTEDKAIEQASTVQPSSLPNTQDEPAPPAPAPPIKPSAPKESAITVSDHQWTESIRRIEDLLDDELRLKALLAPITDTGEPLLRDLTHRVRAFRNVFKTWEELHIDPNDGELRYISKTTTEEY